LVIAQSFKFDVGAHGRNLINMRLSGSKINGGRGALAILICFGGFAMIRSLLISDV
jgi:hypothetical protein